MRARPVGSVWPPARPPYPSIPGAASVLMMTDWPSLLSLRYHARHYIHPATRGKGNDILMVCWGTDQAPTPRREGAEKRRSEAVCRACISNGVFDLPVGADRRSFANGLPASRSPANRHEIGGMDRFAAIRCRWSGGILDTTICFGPLTVRELLKMLDRLRALASAGNHEKARGFSPHGPPR
jgi:hypothetical protein